MAEKTYWCSLAALLGILRILLYLAVYFRFFHKKVNERDLIHSARPDPSMYDIVMDRHNYLSCIDSYNTTTCFDSYSTNVL